jgi:hypothetical protein
MACRCPSLIRTWNLSVDENHRVLTMAGLLSGSFGLRRSQIETQEKRIRVISAGDVDF